MYKCHIHDTCTWWCATYIIQLHDYVPHTSYNYMCHIHHTTTCATYIIHVHDYVWMSVLQCVADTRRLYMCHIHHTTTCATYIIHVNDYVWMNRYECAINARSLIPAHMRRCVHVMFSWCDVLMHHQGGSASLRKDSHKKKNGTLQDMTKNKKYSCSVW